ncbi:sensor histidine kinase [Kitasatospora sp. GP82]|uniref:sensor histidine kinase n=1 Tax=Kitasatospora sp. GP82 TaxID=3035089 RepID=UPI0024751B4F|nr:sensor histidine kinase [Kitasatospora sp. GP82]MDH6128197.1 signal transduction histidine kinase [Kitasatospora sp. GP82]
MTDERPPWRPPWARTARAPWPVASSVLVAFVQVAGTKGAAAHQSGRPGLDAFGYLLLLLGPALLLFRRRRPAVVAGAVSAVTVVYLIAGYPYGPVFLSPVVALFVAVQCGHRRAAWLSAAAFYTAHLLLSYVVPAGGQRGPVPRPSWWSELGVAAWLLLILAAAEIMRFRREQIAAHRAARAEAERRRADEERLRMARELHDILAHSISLIHLQAGVALELLDSRPEQARTALVTIKAASKEALGEVRQVLGRLRGPDASAPRSPAPGLARLDELVRQAGHAGLTVTVRAEGTPRQLSAGLDLAAFRIVQEALTNVIRHSAARGADVLLDWQAPEGLAVQVDDPGPAGRGNDADGSGSGLVGMRERVAAFGGTLETGPRADGGFRVHAWLPTGDAGPGDSAPPGDSARPSGGGQGGGR